MKLYIDAAFRWGAPLELKDASGRTRYRLTGDAYSLRKQLHVTDLAGREAVLVRQVIPSLLPRYEIEVYGKPVGELIKDLTCSPARFTVQPTGWEIVGLPGAGGFTVTRTGNPLAASRPEPSGSVVLELPEDRTALSALGVMLATHCIFAGQEPKHPQSPKLSGNFNGKG